MRETDTLLEQIRSEARLLRVYATSLRQHGKMQEAAHLVARLAAEAFDTPMANVSLLYSDRQSVVAGVGIDEADFAIEETYCQHLLVTRDVMAINDSTEDERVNKLDATTRDGIRTYLGAPLTSDDGYIVGSLCVYDTEARTWRADEVELIERLAQSLMGVDRQVSRQVVPE